jgi:hypothetical protein
MWDDSSAGERVVGMNTLVRFCWVLWVSDKQDGLFTAQGLRECVAADTLRESHRDGLLARKWKAR